MRQSRISLALLLGVCSLTATAGQLHGIDPGDINTKGDACTDFFDYANGAWRAKNTIPDDMDRWSRRWQSGEVNKGHVRDILTGVSARKDWPAGSAQQLSGDFYAGCMDEAKVDGLGLKPVQPLLDEVAGIKSKAALQASIRHLGAIGIAAPFGLYSNQDLHDPANVIAQLDAGRLGLPDRDYYLKPDARFVQARAKYLDHVAKMLVLAGATPARAAADAKTVLAFETRLASATLDNVASRDPANSDHKMTFAQLQALAPGYDWGAHFDGAHLPRIALNVAQPAFLTRFNKELATTPLAQWRTYLHWAVLHNEADLLSGPLVAENFAFYGTYLSGAAAIKPRAIRCAQMTDGNLGDALGHAYVEKYFPPEAKARMQDMVKNILLAMHDTIQGLDWMTPQTKTRALEKLAGFNAKLGYPDAWKDYKGVTVSRADFFGASASAARWNVADDLSQVGKPVDRTRWGMTPPTSNAYYSASLNEIVFPAGILQPPAFDVNGTDAVNYGGIGVVIGHEISHGFDDQGAKFDAKGRLENWWTAEDHAKFEARGACVVKQFDNYFIEPGIHHNGKLVLGESIGDLGGAKLAYRAYQTSRQAKGPEPTIDGFTPEQQFFLAWGQWRGDETRPATQRTMVQTDPHPIAKFRVNGPLSNLAEFQAAFHCKPDATMVRPAADRCEVW